MSRRQKDLLRPLTTGEYAQLAHLSRATSEPAATVAHAKALLAVAAGQDYTTAARAAGGAAAIARLSVCHQCGYEHRCYPIGLFRANTGQADAMLTRIRRRGAISAICHSVRNASKRGSTPARQRSPVVAAPRDQNEQAPCASLRSS